jgi:hypothetical protein
LQLDGYDLETFRKRPTEALVNTIINITSTWLSDISLKTTKHAERQITVHISVRVRSSTQEEAVTTMITELEFNGNRTFADSNLVLLSLWG